MITVVQNRTRNRRPSDGYRVSRPGGCWWWVPVLERRGRVVRPRDRPSLGYSRRQPWFRRSRVRPGRGTPDPPLAILISQHSVYYLRNGRIFNGNARARPVAFGRPRHRSAREAHHRRSRTRGPLRDRPTDPWPDTRERDHPSSEFRWRPVERTRSIADRRDSPGWGSMAHRSRTGGNGPSTRRGTLTTGRFDVDRFGRTPGLERANIGSRRDRTRSAPGQPGRRRSTHPCRFDLGAAAVGRLRRLVFEER